MDLKSSISVAGFIIALGAIFLLLIRQQEDKKVFDISTFKGKVVSSEKVNKGYHRIRYMNGNTTASFNLSYEDGSRRAYSGDLM